MPESPAPFQVPYQRDARFVGREEALTEIHARRPWPVALTGPSGVGKTSLAVEYAYRYRDAYPGGVYWLDAAFTPSRLALDLGLDPGLGSESTRQLRLAEAFCAHLGDDALVICDDTDPPDGLPSTVRVLRPTSGDGGWFETIPVTALAAAEAEALLGGEDAEVAADVARSLEFLPLALATAAAWRRFHHTPLRAWRDRHDEPAPFDPRGHQRAPAAAEAAIRLQWEALTDEAGRRVLQTLAVLGVGVGQAALALLTGLAGPPGPLSAALETIHRLGLADTLTDGTIRLHPLVRRFVLSTLDADPTFASRCAETLCDALWETSRLEAEVARRGVDAVRADLRLAESLAGARVRARLSRLTGPLDREVERLRRWSPELQPSFFLQQLQNRAFELGDAQRQQSAEAELDARGLPHLRARNRTSRDSAALLWNLGGGSIVSGVAMPNEGRIVSFAVTPDGRRVITGTEAEGLVIWDLASGQAVRRLAGGAPVADLAVTRDGRHALATSFDGTLCVWDLEGGRCVRTLETDTRAVFAVAPTPDGTLAVSASFGILQVWEVATGQRLRTLHGHGGSVVDVAVTPDGRFVFSAAHDFTIKLWEIATGELVRTFEGHEGHVYKVAVTSDGRFAVSAANDGTIRMWHVATGQQACVLERDTDAHPGVAVTPDGRSVVCGSGACELRVWDHDAGRVTRTLGSYVLAATDIAVTPDARFALTSGWFGSLLVWDLDNERRAPAAEGHSVWQRDVAIRAVAVTPDGRFALAASEDHTLQIWDLATLTATKTLAGHAYPVRGVAVTADGQLAVSVDMNHTLIAWDLVVGEAKRTIDLGEGPHFWADVSCVTVTTDGRFAVCAWESNNLGVWELSTGVCVHALEGHTAMVGAVAVTPDGRFAVSGSKDATVRVWDLATGRCAQTLAGHTAAVRSVAASPDGRFIVSASDDRTISVWDLSSGRAVRTFAAAATAIAVSPDGRLVCAVSGAGVEVWDLLDGARLSTLDTHGSPTCCAIAPDGTTLVVGGEDHGIYLFGLANHPVGRPG